MKGVGFLEELLFDLQLRGFRVAARAPRALPDLPARIATASSGSSTATSTARSTRGRWPGRFGTKVRDFALELVRDGLVHDIASDSHDAERRPPGLLKGIEAAEEHMPGLTSQAEWYTRDAPGALLAGRKLPPRPELPEPPPPRGLRRLLGRNRA